MLRWNQGGGNRVKVLSIGSEALRLTVAKVITVVVSMLTVMLLARYRTVEEYGTYAELLLVANLGISFIMLGLPHSINYFLAKAETEAEKKEFLSVYYTISTALSLSLGVALVLAVPLIEDYFHNAAIRGFVYFFALYPWALVAENSIENVLVVYRRTNLLMAYKILYSVAIISAVILTYIFNLSFSVYIFCFVVENVIFALWTYWIVYDSSGGLAVSFDWALIESIFAFSVPIGLATFVGTLNVELDKLLIGYMMDTEQVAIYTNAARELPVGIITSSCTAVLLPRFVRMVKQGRIIEAVKLWGYSTEISLIVIAVLAMGIFTYAEAVIAVLYSEKYLSGIIVFRIYILNLFFRSTYFGMFLNAYGYTQKIFYCSVASLVMNLALNPLFFFFLGIIGPAIATFLVICLIMVLQLYMTSRLTNISLSRLLPWRNILLIMGINVAFSIIFWEIKNYFWIEIYIGEIGESILLGVVWLVAYFAIMRQRIMSIWKIINRQEEMV